jgi:transposase
MTQLGTWEWVFTALMARADADEDLNWAVWRGLAARYDKTATIYLAGLHLAGVFIWSAR